MANDAPQVLVIDDSEIALEVMLQTLRRASIPAIGMASAIGATRIVLRHDIRVVVADVNMPVLAGHNLVSMFRSNPKLMGVKVVFVSGLGTEQLAEIAEVSGADEVLAKDDVEMSLVSTVRRLLRGKALSGTRPKAQLPGDASRRVDDITQDFAAGPSRAGRRNR